MSLLEVDGLTVTIKTELGTVHAVNSISFHLEEGEMVAIVGESGCGKSVTGLALTQLLPQPAARIEAGRISFDGQDLTSLPASAMHALRGRELSMIFQDPMTSLNPVITIGEQLAETLMRSGDGRGRKHVHHEALRLLDIVGIPGGEVTLRSYPHQLSGGMRQRVMIAMALALKPRLLVADEPTTGLDVTVEAQVLDLMMELVQKSRTAMLLITHDLGVVAGTTQRVIVMYSGMVVETATTEDLFAGPLHPYTIGLLKASPRIDSEADEPLLAIEGVPPNQLRPLTGCPFAPRCRWRIARCWSEVPSPAQRSRADERPHLAACHNPPSIEDAAAGYPLDPGFSPAMAPAAFPAPGEVVTFSGRVN